MHLNLLQEWQEHLSAASSPHNNLGTHWMLCSCKVCILASGGSHLHSHWNWGQSWTQFKHSMFHNPATLVSGIGIMLFPSREQKDESIHVWNVVLVMIMKLYFFRGCAAWYYASKLILLSISAYIFSFHMNQSLTDWHIRIVAHKTSLCLQFMTEMRETAYLLENLTSRWFILFLISMIWLYSPEQIILFVLAWILQDS